MSLASKRTRGRRLSGALATVDETACSTRWVTYLQVAPLALVFLLFLVVPIATIIVVSFCDYNTTQIIPAFLLQNYEELLLSPVTWRTYLQTLQFAAITWALTLVIGFLVAYFLAFHVRIADLADGAVPGLHHAVPDLQHHPHDLVDPVPRPQRARSTRR